MNEIKPGFDGMPPVRDQQTQYTDEEKIKIAAKASVAGLKPVADLYGLKWQTVRSWKSRLLGTKLAATAFGSQPAETKTAVIIQTPDRREITVDEILARTEGQVEKIYIRVDENKAYWVKSEEHGSVDLW